MGAPILVTIAFVRRSSGGVGILGSFGDILKRRVQVTTPPPLTPPIPPHHHGLHRCHSRRRHDATCNAKQHATAMQPWQSERWHRITMAVTCAPAGKKGEFKTWVEDAAMASLQASLMAPCLAHALAPRNARTHACRSVCNRHACVQSCSRTHASSQKTHSALDAARDASRGEAVHDRPGRAVLVLFREAGMHPSCPPPAHAPT